MNPAHIIKKYFFEIIIVFFLIQIFVSATRFALTDRTPKYLDYATHVSSSLGYYDAFLRHDLSYILLTYTHYPPFMYWVLAIYFLLFGYSLFTIILFNFSLILILAGIIYWYTKQFHDGITTGITTIFAIGSLILITQQFYEYIPLYNFMLDFPLIVTVTSAYFLLLYGIKHTDSIKHSGLIGTAIGIAILTKWTAVTILTLPFLWYVYKCWKRNTFAHIAVAMSFILLSGGWWYLINFKTLLADWTTWVSIKDVWSSPSEYINHIKSIVPLSSVWLLPSIPILYTSLRNYFSTVRKNRKTVLTTRYFFWAYINLSFSFLFFVLVPVHDYRFLYATIYLLYITLFQNIVFYANVLQKKVLSFFVIIFTVIAIIVYQPVISRDIYSIQRLEKFIETTKSSSFGVFIEDTTLTFNHPNILLLFTERSLFKQDTSEYTLLNRFGYECDKGTTPDMLAVFTASSQNANRQWHNAFTDKCPSEFRNMYTFFKEELSADGTIKYFQKQSL